jgi:acetolactate synthase-1/2/3 large subunit
VHAVPRLVAHALANGRPVYLGVPADILASTWAGPDPTPAAGVGGSDDAHAHTPPAPDQVAAVADAVRDRTIALWLGARAVAAEDEVRRLAQRLGALVVPTYQARGMLADLVGTVGAPPHEPAVAAQIAARDVLLVVGDELAGMTTRNWRMPVPPTVVAITDDEEASLGDYPLAARVVGDVATSVTALLDVLGDTDSAPPMPDGGALASAVRDDVAGDPTTAAASAFLTSVDEGWPDSGAVVVDMCIAGYWIGGYSRQRRARRLQYPVGWGTLGFALPAAIGPAALGIPTLAVVGDGGAAMGIGELATYAQERLPVALLVVTDGGYGMLRFDQAVAGDQPRGVTLVEPHWEDLAAAYDLKVVRTDDPGQGLARALAQARNGLTCGERWMVVLEAAFHPPRTTSPRWREG